MDAAIADKVDLRTVRLSDYVGEVLAQNGVKHVFMLTGGGAMHLNDALGHAPGLQYICCHHEQALAMAADAYARLSGRMACVNVTTGPGGINALNGVFGAYTDSIPMIVVSGQVKRETMAAYAGVPLRQLGDQEAPIVAMVKPVTKFAAVVHNPADIRYLLEKAIWLAQTGRPGPVWLDIPIDVQAMSIAPDTLRGFNPRVEAPLGEYAVPTEANRLTGIRLRGAVHQVVERLRAAERPVILAGAGVRLSKAHNIFLRVIERLGVPVTSAWNAHDVIWDEHPCYAGRPGSIGDRAGNFAVQNADCLLVLGSRLNIRQISYNYRAFARHAFKIMVDVDTAEMAKPTLSIDMPVHADLREFLGEMDLELDGYTAPEAHSGFLAWARARRQRYPTVLPEYWEGESGVNPYCFAQALFDQLDDDEHIVTADGTACVATFQAARLKPGQRLFTNSGSASMGFELPAAIGAWHADPKERIICIAGDGSIMQNLQELQTIVGQKIPAKIFLLNNTGYHSIRQTQQTFFPGSVVGCGPESGVSFPDFSRVADAFGLGFVRVEDHVGLAGGIAKALSIEGPVICELMIDKAQVFAPRVSSRRLEDGSMVSAPLEDMAPFLPRDELRENMLGPLRDE